ncbi:MAG: DUF47 domain-containing protein [Acidimicrobiia bacterium]
MRFRLVPRDEGFYGLFDEAAKNVVESARLLRDMLDGLADVAPTHELITQCERTGDEVTRTILRRLDRSFVTPFDREDIHALTEQLDDVVDDIQAASELFLLHRVEKPLPEMGELAEVLVKAADANVNLIAKLPKLKDMRPDLEAIDRLESEADQIYRRSVGRLFSGEFEAFDVLKLKDIVEAVEHSVNGIENVSDIVESIFLKHA